jgi:hypothetical protein
MEQENPVFENLDGAIEPVGNAEASAIAWAMCIGCAKQEWLQTGNHSLRAEITPNEKYLTEHPCYGCENFRPGALLENAGPGTEAIGGESANAANWKEAGKYDTRDVEKGKPNKFDTPRPSRLPFYAKRVIKDPFKIERYEASDQAKKRIGFDPSKPPIAKSSKVRFTKQDREEIRQKNATADRRLTKGK